MDVPIEFCEYFVFDDDDDNPTAERSEVAVIIGGFFEEADDFEPYIQTVEVFGCTGESSVLVQVRIN